MAHQDERAYNGLGSSKSLCHRNVEEDGDVLPANTAFNVHEWIRAKNAGPKEMGRRPASYPMD